MDDGNKLWLQRIILVHVSNCKAINVDVVTENYVAHNWLPLWTRATDQNIFLYFPKQQDTYTTAPTFCGAQTTNF